MINYSLQWKKKVNLKDIPYDDFVTKFRGISSAYFIEKIDGILGSLVYEKGKDPYFVTINNIVIKGLPVIDEYNDFFKKSRIVSQVVLVGELVAIKSEGILPFNQISSIVRTSDRQENKPLIYHYLYDVLYLDKSLVPNYSTSLRFIRENFSKRFQRVIIPKVSFGDIVEFVSFFKKHVGKSGIEGVVVRTDTGKNYKVKPTNSVDVVVIGAGNTKMKAWSKNQISYLIAAFMDPTGVFRRTSNVGTGYTDRQREELYEFVLRNKISEEIDGEFFIKPKLVIEVEYDRYRVGTSPSYKFEHGKMIYDGNRLSVKIDFPSFKRIRTDKRPTSFDTRLTQIPDIRI